MYQAAAEGSLERIRELLNCGEQVSRYNILWESSEQSERKSDKEKGDRGLELRELTTEETDQDGWTPLHVAAKRGNSKNASRPGY